MRSRSLVMTILALALAYFVAFPSAAQGQQPDLDGIKAYLLQQCAKLEENISALKEVADAYYGLSTQYDFDYSALWNQETETVRSLLLQARSSFLSANSAYELMEGIVAGVPALAPFDVDIDAGVPSGEGDGDVVRFDVPLPDGNVLRQPGNFFYLAELTLWGTNPEWTAQGVQPDLDGNGTVDFAEVLPDANVFKGIADAFLQKSRELSVEAKAWRPRESDAFTALVVMIPTMDEYFQAWKESRYVSGAQAVSPQFVATSRLQDIADILHGLQVVYTHIEPLISALDPAQAQQIEHELSALRDFVLQVLSQETAGVKFNPEDADLLGSEAQHRATAIAGQIAQAAAKLGIDIQG
ncbi:MAG: EfeM/EfeO family lipoprotein [Firmicutes bacterium]|nr:EfeM/EfeO family lipoprotein [Bacillota bacterium]